MGEKCIKKKKKKMKDLMQNNIFSQQKHSLMHTCKTLTPDLKMYEETVMWRMLLRS